MPSKPIDFDCPDCHAPAGSSCRSSQGKALPTPHTRRLYKAQDAFAAVHVTVKVRHLISRVAFRSGAFTGSLESLSDTKLGESRGHDTWSGAAMAALLLAARRGYIVDNRTLVEIANST